jgi:hypothetical protein
VVPHGVRPHHRVENREELAHTGDEGDLLRLACRSRGWRSARNGTPPNTRRRPGTGPIMTAAAGLSRRIPRAFRVHSAHSADSRGSRLTGSPYRASDGCPHDERADLRFGLGGRLRNPPWIWTRELAEDRIDPHRVSRSSASRQTCLSETGRAQRASPSPSDRNRSTLAS